MKSSTANMGERKNTAYFKEDHVSALLSQKNPHFFAEQCLFPKTP